MLAVLPRVTIFTMTAPKMTFQNFINTMFMAGALGLGGFIGAEFREMRQSMDRRFEQFGQEQRALNDKLIVVVERVGQLVANDERHDKSIERLQDQASPKK